MRRTTAKAKLEACGAGSPRGFLNATLNRELRQGGVGLPGDEAHNTSCQQKTSEASKYPLEYLTPQVRLGGGNDVLAILLKTTLGLRLVKTGLGRDRLARESLFDRNLVPVQVRDFYESQINKIPDRN